MKKNNNSWPKVGSLRKSEKGNLYLKFDQSFTFMAGDTVLLKDPKKSLDESVEKGFISEEKAEEIKNKIPAYIKYDLIVPPSKGGKDTL